MTKKENRTEEKAYPKYRQISQSHQPLESVNLTSSL